MPAGEVEQRVGIVDCLGIGFEKVSSMLWVLLFPLAMGLFLWRGPQLSAAPAISNLLNWYFSVLPGATLDGPDGSTLLADGAQGATHVRELLESLGRDVNLFTFFTMGAGIAGRGSIPGVPLADPVALFHLPAIERPIEALGLAIAFQALGLLFGTVYLGLIAQRVRGEAIHPGRLLCHVWGYWLSIAGFLLGLGMLGLGAATLVALLLGLMFAFAPGAGEAVLMAALAGWQVATIWLTLFTFFVVDAAIVGRLGPLRAVASSIRLVSRNFWSAVGFILLYLVVTYGMLAIWLRLGDAPWAPWIALVGNSYIASGLAAGSMVYYRGRAAALARTTPAPVGEPGR